MVDPFDSAGQSRPPAFRRAERVCSQVAGLGVPTFAGIVARAGRCVATIAYRRTRLESTPDSRIELPYRTVLQAHPFPPSEAALPCRRTLLLAGLFRCLNRLRHAPFLSAQARPSCATKKYSLVYGARNLGPRSLTGLTAPLTDRPTSITCAPIKSAMNRRMTPSSSPVWTRTTRAVRF